MDLDSYYESLVVVCLKCDYFRTSCKEDKNGPRILCKVQSKERDFKCPTSNFKERTTGNPGYVPNLRDQDIPHRQSLVFHLRVIARMSLI